MKFVLGVLIVTAAIYTAYSDCNTCSLNGIACVANDQFQICVDGLPTAPTYQCPSETLCSPTGSICGSIESVQPQCAKCGTCDAAKQFACTGVNTFALCNGTDVPDSPDINCPPTYVCNVDSTDNICYSPDSLVGATCPSVTTTTSTTTTTTTTTTQAPTTTPSPGTNPQAYCAYIAKVGRYDIPTDPTCTTYVDCSLVSGAWLGYIYQCPGTTLFNPTTGLCGTANPPRCP